MSGGLMNDGPRIGLVLGAGGAVGHAFHAGVLAAITDATGWDARDAEVIIGTSAGSLVGAYLRAGITATDLAARETGATLSAEGAALVARAEAARSGTPGIPHRRPSRSGWPTMAAPAAVARSLLQPWRARLGAIAAAALPAGQVSTEVVVAGVRGLFDHWPDAPLWCNAVALDSGARVVFGRDTVAEPHVADAVAASCAIPSFFAPVHIGGRRYVDGGAHSPTNADLAAGLGLDLVVVVSPMSVAGRRPRFALDDPGRRLSRALLGREVARVRAAGTPVLVFQPTAETVAIMGANAMDPTNRAEVTSRARTAARRRLVRPDERSQTGVFTLASRRRTTV